MFNYPCKYVQLPLEVCSTTLRCIFNYPGEYVHYPGEYVTLGSMFNYPGEYVQLPWGVCSTTLGRMFNYLFSTHGVPELFQTLTEHSHSTSGTPQSPLGAQLWPKTEIDDFMKGSKVRF